MCPRLTIHPRPVVDTVPALKKQKPYTPVRSGLKPGWVKIPIRPEDCGVKKEYVAAATPGSGNNAQAKVRTVVHP